MVEFTLTLSPENEQQLQKLAARVGRTPQELLQFQVDQWLETEAANDTKVEEQPMVELAPGEYLAPEGMFPDDGCIDVFVDPFVHPTRVLNFLTPEQRLDAATDIVATIALRAMRKKDEQKEGEDESKSDGKNQSEVTPLKAKPQRRSKPTTEEAEKAPPGAFHGIGVTP